jgi:hypothetical protein
MLYLKSLMTVCFQSLATIPQPIMTQSLWHPSFVRPRVGCTILYRACEMDIRAWGFEPSFIQVRVVYGRPNK